MNPQRKYMSKARELLNVLEGDLMTSVLLKVATHLKQKSYFQGAPKDMAIERAIDGADLSDEEVKFLQKNYKKIEKKVSDMF